MTVGAKVVDVYGPVYIYLYTRVFLVLCVVFVLCVCCVCCVGGWVCVDGSRVERIAVYFWKGFLFVRLVLLRVVRLWLACVYGKVPTRWLLVPVGELHV